MPRLTLFILACLLVAAFQTGHRESSVHPSMALAASPPTPTSSAAPTSNTGSKTPMAANVRGKLPTPFDIRINRALEAPLPDSVVIAFDHIAMAKLPYANYRYQLTADGKLYYVQHSGKPENWQVPFDRPLPITLSKHLDAAVVSALVDKLEAAGFFDHPGYQANPGVKDGSYWIVRARRGKNVHAVVFQNTQPDYVAALAEVADSLWKQR